MEISRRTFNKIVVGAVAAVAGGGVALGRAESVEAEVLSLKVPFRCYGSVRFKMTLQTDWLGALDVGDVIDVLWGQSTSEIGPCEIVGLYPQNDGTVIVEAVSRDMDIPTLPHPAYRAA